MNMNMGNGLFSPMSPLDVVDGMLNLNALGVSVRFGARPWQLWQPLCSSDVSQCRTFTVTVTSFYPQANPKHLPDGRPNDWPFLPKC